MAGVRDIYHPKQYLDRGTTSSDMIMSATKLYDMCNVAERAQWLDILIALIEYLRSGKSKVGYLNSSHERNMLHKGVEEQAQAILAGDQLGQSIKTIRRTPRKGKRERVSVMGVINLVLLRVIRRFRFGDPALGYAP